MDLDINPISYFTVKSSIAWIRIATLNTSTIYHNSKNIYDI